MSPLTLGVLETNLRRVCRTSHAYARRADRTWRSFGGVNVLCFGDWWQLPPVKATAIFSNYFAKHENVERQMLRHFWERDTDGFTTLFELTHAYRFDKDPWLEQILTQHRHGKETWETYCFMHGLPTRNTGSWLEKHGGPTCNNPDCAELAATIWPQMQQDKSIVESASVI